jgi:hypothetical protein
MKREKRLTKRERKALAPSRPGVIGDGPRHIHCVACGRHIEPYEFREDGNAKFISCEHGSTFATCMECESRAVVLLAEHDRTGGKVRVADPWH